MTAKRILFVILFSSIFLTAQKAPLWKTDLGEPIKEYNFINQGKYLFFTSGEYVWCHSVESGSEVWKMEIPDYNEEGINFLLGEMFLTNSDNKLQAYDAVAGKMLWEKEYDDIDQGDYRSMEFIKNNAVFRYDDVELGVDLNNGDELFRMEVDYWGELVNLGTFNYSVLEKQNKMLVMEDSEIASIFDVTNGKKLFTAEGYDINKDLIAKGLDWLYESPDDDFLLFVLEDGAAAVDVKNNKEMARREFGIDGDINAILPTNQGCAVMGEEKFVHFNFLTGEVTELNFEVDDLRTMNSYTIDGKDILIVSMEDMLASIDLVQGKLLWSTKEDDPQFEGYVHRYLKTDGNNIVLTYADGSMTKGTYVYLFSIDAITGDVKYKIPVFLGQIAITGFQRTLADIVMSISTTVVQASTGHDVGAEATAMFNKMLGYDNIGFTYINLDYPGDNIVFYTGGSNMNSMNPPMQNPDTKEEPGEGFVSVNYKTGKVNYRNYFPIAAGFDGREAEQIASPLLDENMIYAAGNERILAFDLAKGKKIWETKIEDKLVTDFFKTGDALCVQYGTQSFDVNLKKDKVELKGTADYDPYGFLSLNVSDGAILWDVKTDSDPVLLTPEFNMQAYFDDATSHLYYADVKSLYALKLGADGGKFSWQMNFENSGIGEYDFGESYAVIEKWIGSVPRTRTSSTYIGGGWSMVTTTTTGGYNKEAVSEFLDEAESSDLSTTYTSWGNIWGVTGKKCLRILYGRDKIVVIGPEKLALVNSADGSIIWDKEWDYDNEEVQFVPKVINGKLVYAMDEKLVAIDLTNGEEIFSSEITEKSKFFQSPDNTNIFNLYDEEISAYSLK